MAKTWKEKVEDRTETLGRRPSFEELMEMAQTHTMTADEREAQRESWVVGELMLANPSLTRVEAVQRYRKASRASRSPA